uniref:Uncharacterized protein n=1 Tax=Craspedostauros australis TaxID=1486917 RepID=A0A7R9WWN0_9STRA|mmetsp:Transcript_21974/g.61182  ORF Transcript_21974/g.61182 Transcript_21974/m.61182 type:complete len:165 (+) Transcript_21974:240-734(+)
MKIRGAANIQLSSLSSWCGGDVRWSSDTSYHDDTNHKRGLSSLSLSACFPGATATLYRDGGIHILWRKIRIHTSTNAIERTMWRTLPNPGEFIIRPLQAERRRVEVLVGAAVWPSTLTHRLSVSLAATAELICQNKSQRKETTLEEAVHAVDGWVLYVCKGANV